MTGNPNGDGTDNGKAAPGQGEQITGLYHNETMKDFVLHKPGENNRTGGPRLYDLSIDVAHVKEMDAPEYQGQYHKPKPLPVSNENFRKIAQEGTEFIAINDGGINLQVKHALDEAYQTDKIQGTKHEHVDQLLAYMNAHLQGTNYSVGRDHNRFMVIDSSDKANKPDAHGKVNVHPMVLWDLDTKKFVPIKERP